MTENNRRRDSGQAEAREDGKDAWYLEDVYPDADLLLQANDHVSARDKNALVVLDTNVLLLPYNVGSEELSKLISVYRILVEQKRLFIPIRVLREFVKNRDEKLGEMLERLNNSNSQLGVPSDHLPPLLDGVPQALAVSNAIKALKEAKSAYLKSIDALRDIIAGWRGNDPVSIAYRTLFTKELQIDHEAPRGEVEKGWSSRKLRQIPPGYKDTGKPDGGIGDYLIWLAVLKLGSDRKSDLIFVTGEEKPDWFVRGIYPRPELIDEYRRASGGRSLRLSKLGDLLSELDAPEKVVEEIRQAEAEASSVQKFATQLADTPPSGWIRAVEKTVWPDASREEEARSLAFHYKEHLKRSAQMNLQTFSFVRNNIGKILVSDDDVTFNLRFIVDAEAEVYLRASTTTPSLSKIPSAISGELYRVPEIKMNPQSGVNLREALDVFVAANTDKKFFLVGRINVIDHARKIIVLAYSVVPANSRVIAP